MKGIVVDIKGKYVVVMTSDGRFFKARNRSGYEIGYEADFAPASQVNTRFLTRVSSIAAAFILALFGIGWGVYAMPYSYVDIDINPSVEITSNLFDRIIKVEALNQDGKKLTAARSLNNMELGDGVAELVNKAVEEGYIESGDVNAVLFSVSSNNKDKSEKLGVELKSRTESELDQSNLESAVVVEKYSLEKQQSARSIGITPGKLALIEKLIEKNPDLSVDELRDKPVKYIMKALNEDKKIDGENDSSVPDMNSANEESGIEDGVQQNSNSKQNDEGKKNSDDKHGGKKTNGNTVKKGDTAAPSPTRGAVKPSGIKTDKAGKETAGKKGNSDVNNEKSGKPTGSSRNSDGKSGKDSSGIKSSESSISDSGGFAVDSISSEDETGKVDKGNTGKSNIEKDNNSKNDAGTSDGEATGNSASGNNSSGATDDKPGNGNKDK